MEKITTILILIAVLLSAVMAVEMEDQARPGGFYLRGEEEKDLIREVSDSFRFSGLS